MPFPRNGSRLKYNTGKRKIEIDGLKFDSKFEAEVYEILRDDPRVEILEFHPKFELQPKYETKDGRKIRAIDYVSDFRIDVEGDVYVVDAKGMETVEFKIKRKIFERRFPEERLVVAHSKKELRMTIF